MSSRFSVWAAASAAVLVVSNSFADDAGNNDGLEPVVVTAQRKQESLQNVGIAISVLSGDSLLEKSVVSVNDLQNAVPSLQVEPAFGSSLPQFRIRGVGFLDYTSNNASPVGVSLDEVAFALPIQTQGQLFDLERVEVLRGPQGTLYGRNTTGGEINFITNKPTAAPEGGFTVEYGSFNAVDAQGYVSGTIADGLLGRLSLATEQGGAWEYNRDTGQRLGGKDTLSLRGQLQWIPSDGVTLHFGVHLSQDKSEETGLQLIKSYTPYNAGAGGPTIPADTSPYVTGWQLDPTFAKFIGLSPGAKPGLDDSNNGVDLSADVDLGAVKLTSITAYDKLIRREYSDWDATQYYDSDEFFASDVNVFSEEFRIAGTASGPFTWVGGLIYTDQDLKEDFYSDFTDAADIGGIALTTYEQVVNSVGVFAQGNYQFADTLKATLGVREDHETRELLGLNTGFIVPSIPTFTGPQSRSTTSNLPSGKLELDYQPTAQTLIYESISRGVKSGGFTAHNTTTAPSADPFEPEKLTAFELGEKSDLTSALRVDAAVFYYRYKDQQILGKVFDDLSQSYIGRFVNADSRISGGELELEWRPIGSLEISQYAGFAEGYYTSTLIDSSGNNYDGRPESFPKWSYGGDASYSWRLADYQLTAESNYSFHDTYSQFYLLGSSDFTIPKYWLANANFTLAPANAKSWSFTLWGRNLFNKTYDTTRNFFLPGTEVAQAGTPATFGIRVNNKF
jgi:outer membrane receptor protein involved in Fe transport